MKNLGLVLAFFLATISCQKTAWSDSILLPNLNKPATGTLSGGKYLLDVNVAAGTITSSSPSVGLTGSSVPTSADFVGAQDGSGNLVGLLTGQQTMANSLACVLPSDQSAIPSSQSGTWNINNISGTVSLPTGAATEATLSSLNGKVTAVNTGAVVVSSSALPSGAATSAKQPALGTAGTASADVISIQGIASMTAVKTDGSGVTQPVSGTVTANIGTSGSLALDASVTGLQVSQGSTTSGQKGGLALGAVTTAAPSYTTAQSSPLSLNTSGGLRVDGSGVTQPVSISGNQAINLVQVAGASVATGHGTASGAVRVELPTDSTGVIGATQNGTWTVQPGNTANTTAWFVNNGSKTASNKARNDYSSTNVTTSAYVQLLASTSNAISEIEIFDSSGQTLVLATGGAGSEVDQIYITPGGNGRVPLSIATSTRVAIKAVSATASVGEIDINFYK